jgi:signal transduction histidine kinase
VTTVRLRLTLFYAGLLATASGLILLASYLLVRAHLHRTLAAVDADRAVSALGSQYLLSLLAVVLLAAGGGWLVSGEVLGPLERAIAAQRRFVANASHELRTPMTAIRTAAEVALDDPEPTVESLRAVLAETVAATEDTDRLMSALLALAGATDGPRADQEVELSAVVGRALPRGARIDADLRPTIVRGDAALLQRAAANLIDNALRHGGADGVVEITAAAGATSAKLAIVDHGPGVPAEEHEQLFTPFRRADDRDPRSGLGLGLSVARGFAEAMGGGLAADHSVGGGLTMRLRLPLAP